MADLLPARFAAQQSLGGMALFEEANWFGVTAAERAVKGLGQSVTSWL